MSGPSRARAVRVRVPLLQPHRAARGTETHRESVLVCLDVGGVEGWGECATLTAPGYVLETTDLAWTRLTAHLLPATLAGAHPSSPPWSMADTAVACALLDAELRAGGRSLGEHLGVEGARVPAGAVVGRPGPGTAAEVADLLTAGYHRVKVKVAPGDGPAMAAVRAELPQAPLSVDANGTFVWDDAAHRDELMGLDELSLACIEQPLAPDDLAGSADLQSRLRTALALDEPVVSSDDVERIARAGAATQVCLKPARLGGAAGTVAAAALAERRGLSAWVGSMMETAVGRAVAVAVAAAVGGPVGDLAPSDRHFADDVADPVVMDAAGTLAVPDRPGASPTPDPAALERFAVDTWSGRA